MMLDLGVFRNGLRLEPPAARVRELVFGTGRHGYSSLSAFLPMPLERSFDFYSAARMADVQVGADGEFMWRGRLEDVTIEPGGVRLEAYGYARAMHDLLYTALWSVSGTAGWRPVTSDELATAVNERYETDNNNRLYMAPKQNEDTSLSERGSLVYELPDGGDRAADTIEFDWEVGNSSGNTWIFQLSAYDDSWTATMANVTINSSSASSSSGSVSQSLGATTTKVVVRFCRDSVGGGTYTGETGATYVKCTNVRIKSTSSSTVTAGEIAGALVADVAGVNADQIDDSEALIAATSRDLMNEIYADMRHSAILDRLAEMENYWWGVWADKRLFFNEKGVNGRAYVVDADDLTLEGSADTMANRVYATYKEAGGRVLRTAVADNEAGQNQLGVVRMDRVQADTTSQTEAEAWRDALLADRGGYALRATVRFSELYALGGRRVRPWRLRAGDTLTIRNLPPTMTADIDSIRTFRIATTNFEADRNVIHVEPDVPTPTLVTLIAQEKA